MELSFHRWNFRSRELSLPGTFVPGSENDVELSLPIIIDSCYSKLNDDDDEFNC